MLFPRSIQWRIAIAYTLLIFATMGGVSLYLITFIRDSYVQALDDRLAQEAVLMADSIRVHFDTRARDTQTLVDFTARMAAATGARITVVDAGGNRLADSQPSAPIPSIVQPEFRSALTGIQGKEVRPDIQTGEEFRFIAAPVIVDDAIVGAIRVGAPTSQVQPNINRIITTVGIAAGVVAFLSIALGYYIGHWASVSIRNVTSGARRLAGGDLDHRVTPIGHDESRDMAEAFNQMAGTLRTIVGDLEQERGRLTAVLETMADGVVVIGSDDIVALINPAAAEMLEVREARPGDSLAEVVRDFELQRLVTQAQERGTPMRGEIELVPGHRSINV
ncbi:MAG: cell wall metabolism sensor histidine kinase WalK, partial [SAR202 cluster bacterium]|nr:cell wall metabolism sensor histidine kinase WalK [SAR202 cluster bacterium]